MRTIRLGVIGGDGIGPEVTSEALKVLQAVTPPDVLFDITDYDLGARRWHATGELLSDQTLADLAGQDVLLLGAIGDPSVPSGLLERRVLLHLRFAFDHYGNLRPFRRYGDLNDLDFVVVREGTEGLYLGRAAP